MFHHNQTRKPNHVTEGHATAPNYPVKSYYHATFFTSS